MADSSAAAGRAGSAKPFRTAPAKFMRDENGVVAITFAFIGIATMLFAGLAIDMARILTARSALIDAADSAALAVGRALVAGVSLAEARDRGEKYFAANVKPVDRAGAPAPLPDIQADPVEQVVRINASVTVPLTLLRLTGRTEIVVPVTSQVRYDIKDLEIGVAIDVTGSMLQSINGRVKMDGLKLAFANFIDQVLPDELPLGRKVRVGVAPYSAAINLGPFAAAASNNRSVDRCVTERLIAQYDDDAPGPVAGYFAVRADGVVSREGGANAYVCPTAALVPLTDDGDLIKREVNRFTPAGRTGGQFGAQWAWNMVSPEYSPLFTGNARPESYAQTAGANPKLIKAVILMTDGVNNTSYRHTTSNQQEIALCTAMKARGVRVFSVGFGLTADAEGQVARATLQACATPGPEYFADASDAAQLDAAFKQFAAVLGKLRINQ